MSNSTELTTFTGWAATSAGAPLERYSYDPGPLGAEEVEVAVEYCGVCHSDQSMIDNEWGLSHYPFIPGHEVVGSIVRVGAQVRGLEVGQRVGIGWYKGSCMHCSSCIEGSHQLCSTVQPTIVGSNGGFADRLRSHWPGRLRYRTDLTRPWPDRCSARARRCSTRSWNSTSSPPTGSVSWESAASVIWHYASSTHGVAKSRPLPRR